MATFGVVSETGFDMETMDLRIHGGLVERGPNYLGFSGLILVGEAFAPGVEDGPLHRVIHETAGRSAQLDGLVATVADFRVADPAILRESLLAGDDRVHGQHYGDRLRGYAGDDLVLGHGGDDDLHGGMGADTVDGGYGDDWAVGGKDHDWLIGGDGQDIVYGNLGDDTCQGGAGNDLIRGGQQNDVLNGGAGDDWLSGDRDNDTMTGGAGADTFHAFAGSGFDRITDFNRAEGDRVRLDPGETYTVSQSGGDVLVTIGGSARLVLADVQSASLTGDWITA